MKGVDTNFLTFARIFMPSVSDNVGGGIMFSGCPVVPFVCLSICPD